MASIDLFVGITSWNSERFIGRCVSSVMNTTKQIRRRVVVFDNCSSDGTVSAALKAGAEVRKGRLSQADALNRLVGMSDARFTLLIHADVILLDPHWFDLCSAYIEPPTILVSPEDIGCGPYSRPFGRGMPESSFLFFDTSLLKQTAVSRRTTHRLIKRYIRVVDFYGPHVTHALPDRLKAKDFSWQPMNVLPSPAHDQPLYENDCPDCIWTRELARLRYGLGNFYSIDGVITHYHNWYDRIGDEQNSMLSTSADGGGFPVSYIKAYTERFLDDFDNGCLVLPSPIPPAREPVAL